VARAGYGVAAWLLWLAFLVSPLAVLPFRRPLFAAARARLPARLARYVDEVDDGIPRDLTAFLRAWMLTVLNWGVKVAVLAWVLALMGVGPLAACLGGALGGELSAVLPVHAPGGIGTYPAGIAAGAAAFGADRSAGALSLLATAAINLHLLTIVSALAGTGLALVLPGLFGERQGAAGKGKG
jgi:uncharacterized membrane protein YbhN (UPF0104 family)